MKASVFVGTSVDGFIARENDALDFLDAGNTEGGEAHGFDEFMATVDALVMGRNTYDVVRLFDKWYYGDKPVFVLSNRELDTPPRGALVERIRGTPHEVVAQLEMRGMNHIYVDGGRTIQEFLRAGLITHLTISHVPILIGSGIPLFGELPKDIPLKLISTREFRGGMVQVVYQIL